MPHYRDGIEARVGDIVVSVAEHTPGLVVGEVLSVNPGSTSCNSLVAFVADPTRMHYCAAPIIMHREYEAVTPVFRTMFNQTCTISDLKLVYRPDVHAVLPLASPELAEQLNQEAA